MGFFGSILRPIEAAFTPAGTHNAIGRDERNAKIATSYGDLFNQYLPMMKDQIDFAKSLYPQDQQSILQSISALGQGGVDAGIRENQNANYDAAGRSAQQSGMLLGSQGYGSGAIQGATQGAYGQAQRDSNDYAGQMRSPQARAQRLMMLHGILSGTMSPSALAPTLQLGASAMGQPAPYVGQGLGGALGGIAGQWAAGGFKRK